MKVEQRLWTITELLALASKIDLNPAWQRGPAWAPPRRILLIDSILRAMDVPKIYLRRLPAGGLYDYEAVDGQQRLRAIWNFMAKPDAGEPAFGFTLKGSGGTTLQPVHGIVIEGKTYRSLSKTLKDRFDNFKIGIAEIVESTNDEIAVLFARLQMGMPLNPAELRNADLGPMRNMIQWLKSSHEFFQSTKIKDDRNRHFDFASYAFAVGAYGAGRDMKATDLRAFQQEFNARPPEDITALAARVGEAMNVLAEVDLHLRHRIIRKWIFVDLLLFVLQLQDASKMIDITKFARAYDRFEDRRQEYTSEPDLLLKGRRKDAKTNDRFLYEYLFAFRSEAAKAASLSTRNKALRRFMQNVEVA